MTETVELTSRLFGRYIEIHALAMRQSLGVAEAMNNGLFAVCRAVLRNSEESFRPGMGGY